MAGGGGLRRASALIVGGGIMGASAAYHLAARGWRDVVVLDRGAHPGEGSTGAATGGFRAQFPTEVNVRLSLLAREKLRRFHDETGGDAGYTPAGYLWLASDERELEALRAAQRVQRSAGLTEAVELTPADAADLNPAVVLDDVIGATFCPADGFVRPMQLLEGYLAAADRLGVQIEWNVEVVGLGIAAGERIAWVRTSGGDYDVEAVVNAAGAWAGRVAAFAGVDLPVRPLRRQIAATVPTALLPEGMPMTIFVSDGFHLRVRDRRVLLIWPGEPSSGASAPGGAADATDSPAPVGSPGPGAAVDPFEIRVDDTWIEAVTANAHRRVPVLREVAVDRDACWAGLYEMSPDKHAILGRAPGCENLFFINGSSGHGVMHSPALGQLLAEIMSEGVASTLDVSALRPSRFAEGSANAVSDLL